jgi:hypothetical protein
MNPAVQRKPEDIKAQDDADLVALNAGAMAVFAVSDRSPSGKRVPLKGSHLSREECMVCHTAKQVTYA